MAYIILDYPRWGWRTDGFHGRGLRDWEEKMILEPAMPWRDEWLPDLPKTAEMEPTDKPMTHWISYGEIGITAAVRTSIEALEPGIHQYHPCIVEDGGRAYEYYTLKVNQSVGDEAWDKEKTKKGPTRPWEPAERWSPELNDDPKLVMRREMVAGKHVYYYGSHLVMSDVLHGDLARSDLLTGLELIACEEE